MKWMLVVILSVTLVGCSDSQTATGEAGGQSKAASSEAMKDAGYKRYRIKSGIIEYEMSGAQKGTETVYFDKWGMREAKYTKSSMTIMGITRKTNQLTIMDGEWVYTIDLDKKTGTKTKNPFLKEITEGAGTKDLGEIGERMMNRMGEQVGSEEVAGKMCEVWEVKDAGSRSWVWNGIPLKTQVNMAGMQITMTATRFEEGALIPEDKFAIPAGATITEGPDVKDLLKRMKKGDQ